MIDSKELRIGNCVEKDGNVFIADFITINMAHNYSPISLTPEILIACGFEYQNNNSHQLDVPLGFCLWGRNGEITIHDEYNNEIGNSVKYLHQLQNIYFALTGNELEIKL